MSETLTVNISDLRSAMQRALDTAEAQVGTEVPLQVDYYWHLPVNEVFDMGREPTRFAAGQVSDDLKAVHDPRERVPERGMARPVASHRCPSGARVCARP